MKRRTKVLTAALSAAMLLGAVGLTAGAAETGASGAVAASVATEAVSALATPQITSTQNIDGGVKINWNKVEGAEAYRVFYLGKSGWRGMGNTTGTSFVDDDVNSGSTYTYTVRCVKEDGSAWMSDYDHTGFQATYIAPPVLKAAYSDYGGVRIDWEMPKGATKARVFYKGRNGWASMADVTESTYLDTVVTSGKTYLYTVRCIDDEGNFVSAYDTKGIYGSYVAAPTIVKTESTNAGLRLSWTPSEGAAKYRVYYKGRSGWVRFGETLGTFYTDDDVNSGSTYTYTVRALDNDNNFVSGYNPDGWKGTYIAAPQISSLENTNEGVRITWGAVKGAELYRVYVKIDNTWVGLGNTSATSFVDDEIPAAMQRTYTVRCIDKDGNWVSDYNRTGTTTNYVPTPYIYRYTTDTETNVTIYWENVGAKSYRVYYYSYGSWVALGTTENTSFKIKQNPVATTYTVRALDANGAWASGYDPVGVVVRRESYVKDVDTNLPEIISHKINEDHKISLAWDPVPRVVVYYVYLETDDGGLKKVGETEERTCTINKSLLGTDLAGKTFVFRVRGMNSKGRFITDYNYNGYHVTYPNALDITGEFTTTAKDIVSLSWNAVPGAETYKIYIYHAGSEEATVIETSRLTYKVRLEHPEDYYAFEVQAYDKDDNIIAIPGKPFEVNP